MTANATFFVTERKDILLVSAKATRFTPDAEALAASMPPMAPEGAPAAELPAPPMGAGAMQADDASSDSIHTVWIKESNGGMHPQKVTVGVTDEFNYEVVSGLEEGDEVVTTMTTGTQAQKATTSGGFFRPPGSEKRTPTTNTQRSGPPQ